MTNPCINCIALPMCISRFNKFVSEKTLLVKEDTFKLALLPYAAIAKLQTKCAMLNNYITIGNISQYNASNIVEDFFLRKSKA